MIFNVKNDVQNLPGGGEAEWNGIANQPNAMHGTELGWEVVQMSYMYKCRVLCKSPIIRLIYLVNRSIKVSSPSN